jgi:hypothetical protein
MVNIFVYKHILKIMIITASSNPTGHKACLHPNPLLKQTEITDDVEIEVERNPIIIRPLRNARGVC